MKRLLLLIVAVLVTTVFVPALAENVDLATAQQAAMDFVRSRGATGQLRAASMPRQLWSHAEPSAVSPRNAAYYIVNTDRGYVVVSGDDRARTILAYSDQPLKDLDDLPDGALFWLDLYKRQIELLQSQPEMSVSKQRQRSSWDHPSESIAPLLNTQWSQSSPFNRMCPTIDDKFCYAGCSAVALAQVMRYWEYPIVSGPVPSYITRSLEIPVSELDSVAFDWPQMLDIYPFFGGYTNEQLNAVTTLLRYAGQAMNMDYKLQGSDADEHDILNAIQFFGFDRSASYVEKSSIQGETYYPDNIWSAMLWNELKNGRPVVYCGYALDRDSTLVGHAFNVDGYNATDDTYHVNFGWRGSFDGYYALNAFVLNGNQFDIGQLMFLNVMPPRPEPVLWVNKEELDMACNVGETITQRVIVAGSDLVSGISASLNDPDGAFSINIEQEISTVTIITVTYAPQRPGNHSATLTLSSQGAQDVSVVINGTATMTVSNPVMLPADSAYIDTTSFLADWTDETPEEYVTEYVLEVASTAEFDTADSCYMAITGLTVDSCLVEGLIAGATYYYRVKALYTDGTESAWSNVETVTLLTPPLPLSDPAMLPADSAYIDTTSFLADWTDETPEEYVTEYVLEVASSTEFDPADSCYMAITGLTVDSCLVEGLIAGATYYYRVRALYTDGTESEWSNVETVTLLTPPLPLSDPAMLPADNAYIDTTSFLADWTDETPEEYVTEYVLEVASTAEFDTTDSCYMAITGLTVDSCLVEGLIAGATYYYRVKALYTDGTESAWSNVETVTLLTPPLPLSDPAMLPADNAYIDTTSFLADWTDETPEEYVTEYVLEVASTAEFDSADSCYMAITGLTVDSCLVEGLIAGATYYYRVKALYTDGTESAWSNVETVTLLTPPLPLSDPAMLPADSAYIDTTSFLADWTDDTPEEYVTEYVLEVASSAEFDSADSCYMAITGLTVDSCLVEGLEAGATYYYRVRALYTDGTESAWSNVETVTLLTPPLPLSDPAMLPADSAYIDTTSFLADWTDETPEEYVTEYVLEVASTAEFDTADSCYMAITGLTVDSCLVEGLIAGATYYYRVKALYTDGTESNWSNVETVTLLTPPLPLSDPAMLPADSAYIDTTSFLADWTDETPEEYVTEYVLEVASTAEFDTADSCYMAITGLAVDSCLVEGLIAGATYYYRVRALYTDGTESAWSNVETVTLLTPPLPLSDPAMLPADNAYIDTTSFLADWTDETPEEYVTEYVLEVASSAEFDTADSCYMAITGLTVDSCLVEGLIAGATYYYRVKALYTDGTESNWSNVETVTLLTPPLPLSNPAMLPADSAYIDTTSFLADWTDETPEEYVTEYVLEVASTAEFDTADSCYMAITGLTVDSCLVEGLIAGATYYYRVRALYTDGTESAWSNVETVTLLTTPLPLSDPAMLPADSAYIDTTSFLADWTDETPEEYVIEYVLEVASTAEFDTADSCYMAITGLTVDSCLVEGLIAGATYYYRVRALYTDGTESAWSNVETVTLLTPPLPLSDPVMLPADSAYIDTTSFLADWTDETPEEYVTEYVLEVASSAAFDSADSCYMAITGLTVDSCLVEGLIAGATYYYRVKALYNDSTESAWSNVETVTLLEPELPHGYQLGDVNHDGEVGIEDVAWLIDAVLSPDIEVCPICADVMPDGEVGISDIARLIDMLLLPEY